MTQSARTPTPGVGPAELTDYWPEVVRLGWFLVGFLVVLLLGRYVLGPTILRIVRSRNPNNRTIQEAIARYYQLLAVGVAVFVGAGVAGYGRFLTNSALVIAAGTLAIGVAAQTVIGSLISGLVLVLDPEFNIGDYIEWEDGEGTIRSITFRVTRVQTVDGGFVTIPNTVLTSQMIMRPYGYGRYQIVERVKIAYDDDLEDALHRLGSVARELDRSLEAPSPETYVEELEGDGVILRVHFWIQNPNRRDEFAVRSAFIRAAKAHLEAAGITVTPAPQRDLRGEIRVDEPRPGD